MRLADGAHADPDLAAAILVLRAEHGTPAQIAALAGRLSRELGTPSGPSGPPAPPRPFPWFNVLLGSALFGALSLWGVHHWTDSTHAPAPSASVPHVARPLSQPLQESAVTSAPQPITAPEISAPPAPSALRTAPIRWTRSGQSRDPASDVEAELLLVQRSQSALETSPARALMLAERHRRAFPEGMFAQEREIIAIEALLRLQEHAALRARAKRFLAMYPDSPHVQRIHRLVP